MNINEKLYTTLTVLFTALIIVGNLTYQKFVIIKLPIHKFELSVGAILYPLTFLITDLISEFYGKEKANFCVKLALFTSLIIAIIISLMNYLPCTSWSKISNETFNQVFGSYSIAFISSLFACYISQAIDIILYLKIKNFTKGKYLWIRSNGSTMISLFIDTSIVINLLTIFGIIDKDNLWPLIINSYSWKLFFTICSTPIFYLSVFVIRRIFNVEKTINSRESLSRN